MNTLETKSLLLKKAKIFLEKYKECLESDEISIEWDCGGARTLPELIADGEMPPIYNDLLDLLKSIEIHENITNIYASSAFNIKMQHIEQSIANQCIKLWEQGKHPKHLIISASVANAVKSKHYGSLDINGHEWLTATGPLTITVINDDGIVAQVKP